MNDKRRFDVRMVVIEGGLVWAQIALTLPLLVCDDASGEVVLETLTICLLAIAVSAILLKRHLSPAIGLILEAHERGVETSSGAKELIDRGE